MHTHTQSTHTKGPWIAFESKEDVGQWYIQKQINAEKRFPAWAIATIPNYQANDEANARLIAASPDLLAALGKFIDCADMQKGGGDSMLKIHFNGPALTAARAAIALAKGTPLSTP